MHGVDQLGTKIAARKPYMYGMVTMTREFGVHQGPKGIASAGTDHRPDCFMALQVASWHLGLWPPHCECLWYSELAQAVATLVHIVGLL